MTGERGILAGVSVSHTDASLDDLEGVLDAGQGETVEKLLDVPAIQEAFVLQTCNRVEAYVVAPEREASQATLETLTAETPEDIVRRMGHEESLRHLLRVAAGLESLVVGEDQILGQVRSAFEQAQERGAIGPILEAGITKAIHVGERVRTETAINDGVVSLASAAVKLVEEQHGLDGNRAVVVGAGEMGALAAKHLDGRVDELVLANRTVERAESLAATLDSDDSRVRPRGLDGLADVIERRDIVISSTGSQEFLLEPSACTTLGETFVVDITRPRDIPPVADDQPELTVYDLDDLEAVTEKTRQRRQQAADRVERIVDEEFDNLLAQYKRKRADAVISAMYESAERVKAKELETAFQKLDLDEDAEAAIEAMADSLVSQLLAPPTNSLRDAAEDDDWTTIHTALQLFDPTDEQTGMPPGLDIEDIPEGVREQLPATGYESDD